MELTSMRVNINEVFKYPSFSETAGSTDNFLNRNQEVILSASLVGLCIISFVAIMLYLFKRKVMSRQKK